MKYYLGGKKEGVAKSWNNMEDETTLNAYHSVKTKQNKNQKSRPTVWLHLDGTVNRQNYGDSKKLSSCQGEVGVGNGGMNR